MARKTYTGDLVDVSFDREVCGHAGECVRGMPEVFNVNARPWINAPVADTEEKAKLLVEVVGRCPTGALRIERHEQPSASEEPSVTHNAEASRYEVRLGDELVGFVDYILSEGRITFTHTEIDPSFEGRGLGSALIRGALDDVAANPEARRVQPLCPFVKGWMQRHPEYLELARR